MKQTTELIATIIGMATYTTGLNLGILLSITFSLVLFTLWLTYNLATFNKDTSKLFKLQYMPMIGVKCPTCAAQGHEVWVIPGKHCHVCNTPC